MSTRDRIRVEGGGFRRLKKSLLVECRSGCRAGTHKWRFQGNFDQAMTAWRSHVETERHQSALRTRGLVDKLIAGSVSGDEGGGERDTHPDRDTNQQDQ